MDPSRKKPHYALLPVCLSIRLTGMELKNKKVVESRNLWKYFL